MYTARVEQQLASLLAWLEPNAFWVVLGLPVVIRLVGHWLPEEVFMLAVGALAARASSPEEAALLLGAAFTGHLVTDQAVYFGGVWLRPRLARFPRLDARLLRVGGRLEASPLSLLMLVPARVLPLGRGAWLAGCGLAGVAWPRFLAVDVLALLAHVAVWCGLGWWMGGEASRLGAADMLGNAAAWTAAALVVAVVAVLTWRRRETWQPEVSARVQALRERWR